MDWTQTFTIIGTLIASMVGVWYAFYNIIDKRMDKLEENMNRIDVNHREDMKAMDTRWEERWSKSEEKWERLFERLLIQDQQRAK